MAPTGGVTSWLTAAASALMEEKPEQASASTWFLDDAVAGVGDLLSLGLVWVLVLHEEAVESHRNTPDQRASQPSWSASSRSSEGQLRRRGGWVRPSIPSPPPGASLGVNQLTRTSTALRNPRARERGAVG